MRDWNSGIEAGVVNAGGEQPVIEEGTFVDLAPGTYSVTLSLPSGETVSEEITVRADSTWALLALPGGGIFPMQQY